MTGFEYLIAQDGEEEVQDLPRVRLLLPEHGRRRVAPLPAVAAAAGARPRRLHSDPRVRRQDRRQVHEQLPQGERREA